MAKKTSLTEAQRKNFKERFNALLELKRNAGFSQREIAKQLGWEPSYLSQLKSGTKCPPVAVIKIAEFFQIPVEQLLGSKLKGRVEKDKLDAYPDHTKEWLDKVAKIMSCEYGHIKKDLEDNIRKLESQISHAQKNDRKMRRLEEMAKELKRQKKNTPSKPNTHLKSTQPRV